MRTIEKKKMKMKTKIKMKVVRGVGSVGGVSV